MVKITVFQTGTQTIIGFDCIGHANYSDGDDIVCAAVSVLVINCINSIETFTNCFAECDEDQESGMICYRLTENSNNESAQLLLKSLILGLEEIESNYEEYIDLIFEEV